MASTSHGITLYNLGVVGIGTEVDLIAVDTKGNIYTYHLLVRNFSHGPITMKVKVKGRNVLQSFPGTKIRFSVVSYTGNQQLNPNHQVGFVCLERNRIIHPFPCKLRELQFNSETNEWVVLTDRHSQRVNSVRYTKPADLLSVKQSPSRHGTTMPQSLAPNIDLVRLTFNDKTIVLPRTVLRDQMKRGHTRNLAEQEFCRIESLNVWLVASDAKKLRTETEATLVSIGGHDPQLVRFQSNDGTGRRFIRQEELKDRIPDGVPSRRETRTKKSVPLSDLVQEKINLKYGDKKIVLSRHELFELMRNGYTRTLSGQDFCHIPDLDVWLVSSDVPTLRTATQATLVPIGYEDSTMVRLERDTLEQRFMSPEEVKEFDGVELVAPDGFRVEINRGDIRGSLKGGTVEMDGEQYRFLPQLHGYLTFHALGKIESSNLRTFNLSDKANGILAGRILDRKPNDHVDGKKPFYTLAPGWVALTPPVELLYEKIISAGDYIPTREVVSNALTQAGKKLPSVDFVRAVLSRPGEYVPTQDQWIAGAQLAANVTHTVAMGMYEDWLYNQMPVLYWLKLLYEAMPSDADDE